MQDLMPSTARCVFSQVVQGLLYLHSHNILHRDLSLSNLLLTSSMDAVSPSLSVFSLTSHVSRSLPLENL